MLSIFRSSILHKHLPDAIITPIHLGIHEIGEFFEKFIVFTEGLVVIHGSTIEGVCDHVRIRWLFQRRR
jgi:hypothetical protein